MVPLYIEKRANSAHRKISLNRAESLSRERRFCVAPMVGCTDLPFRLLARELTSRAWLFSEMIVVDKLRHASHSTWDQEPDQRSALQIAGCSPKDLAWAAGEAAKRGYSEINLNLGCPSKRILAGSMGVGMMLNQEHLCDCLRAMRDAAPDIAVSAKIRLGIGEQMPQSEFVKLLAKMRDAGVEVVYVHARAALLGKVSTAQNRSIPPLNHTMVFRAAREVDGFALVRNGGLTVLPDRSPECSSHDRAGHAENTERLGIMVGRDACKNPLHLLAVDSLYYSDSSTASQAIDLARVWPENWEIFRQKLIFAGEKAQSYGYEPARFTRHLTHFVKSRPGARQLRASLAASGCIHEAADLLENWYKSASVQLQGGKDSQIPYASEHQHQGHYYQHNQA